MLAVEPATPQIPEWIYFEYNRAHMAVFRFADGRTETHDFRVDPTEQTLDISKTWLEPGSEILSATWKRSGDTLQVEGKWGNATPVRLTLERKQMKIRDHQ